PAIDTATSTGAPATDFLSNPRFDDPNVLNLGGGPVPFVDRGALERQAISTSDVDLRTVVVTGPAQGLEDDVVTVAWTVENVGTGLVTGAWFDAVYLSVDPVFTPDDLLLGEQRHEGDLGPGASYTASTAVTLPGVLPGDYHLIVRTDARNEVFEALAKANNAGASIDTIVLDLPALPLGQPLSSQL